MSSEVYTISPWRSSSISLTVAMAAGVVSAGSSGGCSTRYGIAPEVSGLAVSPNPVRAGSPAAVAFTLTHPDGHRISHTATLVENPPAGDTFRPRRKHRRSFGLPVHRDTHLRNSKSHYRHNYSERLSVQRTQCQGNSEERERPGSVAKLGRFLNGGREPGGGSDPQGTEASTLSGFVGLRGRFLRGAWPARASFQHGDIGQILGTTRGSLGGEEILETGKGCL